MKEERNLPPPPFPGIPVADDGTGGVVWVETHVSQAACAFPITPSTNMGVQYAQSAANGAKNLWGDTLHFLEAESEHSSASAAEGFALAGGRVTNFTSGQGLILMKEVLYVISGKRLPVVFNIGARALTSQALNVHAGHDDVMGVSDVGWGMLFARNAQEAADLCLISRRCAEATETPFMNVQDGFLTTHTLETIRLPEPELMASYIGPPGERLRPVFDTEHGIMSGVVQNQEAYMRGKIAQRFYTSQVPMALEVAMEEFHGLTGRHYGLVNGYRMAGAEYALVALGSTAETAEVVADYLREQRGIKVGVVHPTAFRPFPGPQLVEMLKDVKALAVIERMDDPIAQSNPLTTELKASFFDALTGHPGYPQIHRIPEILSGSAGLGSRDVRTTDLIALVEALEGGRKDFFTLNIAHPSSLEATEAPDLRPEGAFSMRGYSIGGFGSVTTNKVIATVSAELFGLHVQAYPRYGSEKKGLPTNYYLTLAHSPIRTHCEMDHAEFVPINTINALEMGNPFQGMSDRGIAFVQWPGEGAESEAALWKQFPMPSRRSLRQAGARVFYLDAAGIARQESPLPELEIRMQGIVLLGVFLRCAPFREQQDLQDEELMKQAEVALRKYFGRLSEEVVMANLRCVQRGFHEVKELPQSVMAAAEDEEQQRFTGHTVGEFMHLGVITCRADQPLPEVMVKMSEQKVSALVVTNENKEMEGIISTTDLTRARLSPVERMELPALLPRHLMTRDVIVTWPGESLKEAVNKMLSHQVHRLVVTESPEDRRHPVGILSMGDLSRIAGRLT